MEQQEALHLLQQKYNKLKLANKKLHEENNLLKKEIENYKRFIGGNR